MKNDQIYAIIASLLLLTQEPMLITLDCGEIAVSHYIAYFVLVTTLDSIRSGNRFSSMRILANILAILIPVVIMFIVLIKLFLGAAVISAAVISSAEYEGDILLTLTAFFLPCGLLWMSLLLNYKTAKAIKVAQQ